MFIPDKKKHVDQHPNQNTNTICLFTLNGTP